MNFLRKPVTARRVGYHPEHIMRLVREGKFPKPVQLGPRSIALPASSTIRNYGVSIAR